MTDFRQQFLTLDELLSRHRHYWHSQPFVSSPEWADQVDFLSEIEDDRIHQAQASDSALLQLFQMRFPKLCGQIAELCTIPVSRTEITSHAPPFVPGRKWRQIASFAHSIKPLSQPTLEWCCGKGHLSRYLSQLSASEARGLEIDAALVAAGKALAQKAQQPVQVIQVDVLDNAAAHHISSKCHVVGLHACGGLHRKLLTDATAQQAARLSYSPCCYHKFLDRAFQALSAEGQNSDLQLTLTDLRTAVRQNSTAGSAERRRHHLQQRWRLGFDELQRELRQVDQYLPTPPLPASALQQDFEYYCRLLAKQKKLRLPAGVNFSAFELRGRERYRAVIRQELLRALFRRPLELWLVLDQILFLQAAGYRCELTSFCPQSVTPRNLLIDAHYQH
jgi:hypothetical protein